tara:strand:- start:869 stop:1114 length:246 start_codon:yes stop_codon:yes gene_type:complete
VGVVKMLNWIVHLFSYGFVLQKDDTGLRDESSSIPSVFLQSNDLMSQNSIRLDFFDPSSLGSLGFGCVMLHSFDKLTIRWG